MLAPRVGAMDACSSAHHWARQFQAMGIEVHLISPEYVAPFVKTNKNDVHTELRRIGSVAVTRARNLLWLSVSMAALAGLRRSPLDAGFQESNGVRQP